MKSFSAQFKFGKWSKALPSDLDSDQSLIVAFYDPTLDIKNTLLEVKKLFPKSILVGCSGSGEIYDSYVFDKTISISITKFEHTKIKLVKENIVDGAMSMQVGAMLGEQLKSEDLSYVFILSDGLNVNGTDLASGINSVVSSAEKNIIMSGGLAGDGSRFQKTFVILNENIESKIAIAIGFYGDKLNVGTGSVGGWDAFGPERIITSSDGNVLKTIDGKPALEIYKSYLGDQAKNLPASALLFPLSISHMDRKDIVRTVLSVNEADQSLIFAGDIPEGSKAQLMKANFSRLVEGASNAAQFSIQNMNLKDDETLAFAISCVGRRLVLGEHIEDETEAVKSILPSNATITGFYSYGELSPNGMNMCDLHNQTMTLTVLQEKK